MIEINTEHIKVHRMEWIDQDQSVSAGQLLSALTLLTSSKREANELKNKDIEKYLIKKDLIQPAGQNRIKIKEGKLDEAINLGNNVSQTIEQELAKLFENIDVSDNPTIKIFIQ